MTPAIVKRAAVRAKLDSTVLKKPLKAIRSEHMPCILILKDEEACVLLDWDIDKKSARVILPELTDAEIQYTEEVLSSKYAGYAIVIKPQFTFDNRAPKVGRVRLKHWFWGTLAENSGIYRDIMLAAFLINLFALAMPIFTMNVYDRILPNRSIETLWVLVIGVVLIVCADVILRTMRGYFLDWASHRVDIKLSGRIMEQVLGTRLEHRPNSVGSFSSNLKSFETVRDFITSATITALIDIPFALIFIGVIAWIAWPMVIPVIIGAVIMLLYSFSVQTKMHELSETMFRAGAIRNH